MLGIDISKDHLACALLDEQGTAQQWTVPNSQDGVQQLLQATEHTETWVLEPTGPYCRDVVTMAQQAGRAVLLAEPKRARAYLQSVSPRAKTDRLDSVGLAAYAQAVELRSFPRKSEIVEQIEQLLSARKGVSQSITRLTQQRNSLPHARAALEPVISELHARRDAIDEQINEIRANCPDLAELTRRLKAVPGIGDVTANALAACLSSRDFRHSDQFVAFTGLDIQVHDSGRRQGKRRISKHGNAELRRLLYVAAKANIRSRDEHNPFKQQYQRELDKGLPKPGAICAVARKLARTAWSLHRYGSTYDPSRVNQQPR